VKAEMNQKEEDISQSKHPLEEIFTSRSRNTSVQLTTTFLIIKWPK